eukprot:6638037-Pyramimonas_sp.AAC.2
MANGNGYTPAVGFGAPRPLGVSKKSFSTPANLSHYYSVMSPSSPSPPIERVKGGDSVDFMSTTPLSPLGQSFAGTPMSCTPELSGFGRAPFPLGKR